MGLKTQTSLRLPPPLYEQAKEVAAQRGITVSELIAEALTELFDKMTPEEQAREIAKYLKKELANGSH